ncbi:hypothetical protein DD237_006660 [Peronospora effusa]|uniref:Uncharacterized protein n=1 Tax=Peronospora effusa TaxID=542832 RepID=A0A3R7W470_9STRA|nr:hypothetical protein DD237_006660 [Peronospora effusa]
MGVRKPSLPRNSPKAPASAWCPPIVRTRVPLHARGIPEAPASVQFLKKSHAREPLLDVRHP